MLAFWLQSVSDSFIRAPFVSPPSFSVPEDAEEIEEEVDEVKIERETAHQGNLHHAFVGSIALAENDFHLLSVVGSQSAEDEYADVGQSPAQPAALEKGKKRSKCRQSSICCNKAHM